MVDTCLRPDWRLHIRSLETLTTELHDASVFSEDDLTDRLDRIFGKSYEKAGVDVRIIVLIEFCFFKAEGPYSPKFEYFSKVVSRILSLSPGMLRMLNRTADAAIANMVLNARGKLKFKISDYYELKRVLEVWAKMGLLPRSVGSVFRAVTYKWDVKKRLKEKDVILLARLRQVFPFYEQRFVPEGMDLSRAIFKHQKLRFDGIIKDYQKQKLSLGEMIQKENLRTMPAGINRNNFLSYLVKKRHKYKCQICYLQKRRQSSQLIEAHHIVAIEQGGADHSSNMIVLCKKHHDAAHARSLQIDRLKKLRITYKGKQHNINYN